MISARIQAQLGRFRLEADFEAPAQGITAVFGRSGCGKTSLLRCIAGLERATDSFISVNDEVWQDKHTFVPVHKRAIGYVFQEASLFPHLSISENLEYGMKRVAPAERVIAFDHVLALLALEPLLDREPARLSGGERQRVAIGRALLTSPRLLLMDEPLASLDAISKEEILPYLAKLRSELKIPVLYVTHSEDEIGRLADHLLRMDSGKVIETRPNTPTMPVDAIIIQHDGARTWLEVDGNRFPVPLVDAPAGSRVSLSFRRR